MVVWAWCCLTCSTCWMTSHSCEQKKKGGYTNCSHLTKHADTRDVRRNSKDEIWIVPYRGISYKCTHIHIPTILSQYPEILRYSEHPTARAVRAHCIHLSQYPKIMKYSDHSRTVLGWACAHCNSMSAKIPWSSSNSQNWWSPFSDHMNVTRQSSPQISEKIAWKLGYSVTGVLRRKYS